MEDWSENYLTTGRLDYSNTKNAIIFIMSSESFWSIFIKEFVQTWTKLLWISHFGKLNIHFKTFFLCKESLHIKKTWFKPLKEKWGRLKYLKNSVWSAVLKFFKTRFKTCLVLLLKSDFRLTSGIPLMPFTLNLISILNRFKKSWSF